MAKTTSLSNTPQAEDDLSDWTEQQLLASGLLSGNVLTLDVMSNDRGGKAKTLFSIDDGNGHTSATDYDLLNADQNGAWETIGSGDRIRIYNGQIQVDLTASLAALGATNVGALAAGDHIHEEFVYAIQLGNGTLSQAKVVVDIDGQNDIATITTSGHEDTSVTEAGGVNNGSAGDPGASGQLTLVDPDHGQNRFQAIAPAELAGAYGNFSFDTSTGAWTYTLDQTKADPLPAGSHATETLTVTSLDGTASRTITVQINGTNDAPVLQALVGTGQQFDETSLTLSGTMAFSDVDLPDQHSVTVTPQGSGYIGTFTPVIGTDSTGTGQGSVGVTYHLTLDQFEAANGNIPDHQDYLVTINDGHGGTSSQLVSIPLAEILNEGGGGGPTTQPPVFTGGANPFTSGHALGQITDNPFILHPGPGDLHAQGTLFFSDPDGGTHQASVDLGHAFIAGHFAVDANGVLQPVTGGPVGTLTGTWQVSVQEPGQIFWSYTLPESAIRPMAQGESQTMLFPITVYEDGVGQSTQNVRIELFGTTEVPSLLPPNTVLTASTDISPYLVPPDLATHIQTQNFSITEDPLVTGSTSHHTLSGTISFVDPDRLDHPTVSMELTDPGVPLSPEVQALQAGFHYTVEQFGNYGMIHWTYDVQDSALDFLPQDTGSDVMPYNGVLTVSARFSVSELAGGSSSTVSVTLHGSNDAVAIAGSDTSFVTLALASGSASGSFTFSDPDWYPDGHMVEFVPRNPDLHGFIFGGGGVESGSGGNGQVVWTYSVNPATGTLAAGHDIFDVVVRDHFGSVATHTLDFLLI